ncbi:MAG: type II toxin-antitoxin system VapC family toxin [Alphaproteobacteria bacterium]|nr:MAG: type II toxin-antitoxin system VapC family toxin [Alphaproteobacteria bacterium]
MMLDSSAAIALLAKEPAGPRIADALARAQSVFTVPTVRLETVMVLSTLLKVEPEVANAAVNTLFERCSITLVPVTDRIATKAVLAFAQFGKGRGHPARLNFGDCLVYAAAKVSMLPLLFIGSDFIHTDIVSVLDDPRPPDV